MNTTGDVVGGAHRNDLASHTLALPTWELVPGVGSVIDDRLGVNSGSTPFGVDSGGYVGVGARHAVAGSVASFGRLDVQRGG